MLHFCLKVSLNYAGESPIVHIMASRKHKNKIKALKHICSYPFSLYKPYYLKFSIPYLNYNNEPLSSKDLCHLTMSNTFNLSPKPTGQALNTAPYETSKASGKIGVPKGLGSPWPCLL